MLKTMIDSGDAAEMGGTTFLIYAVIKSHSNFRTGQAFPAIETIAGKAKITGRQVITCIKKLEEMGYISKQKKGRQNHYTLREKVHILDDEGRLSGIVSWPYIPCANTEAIREVKNYILSGEHNGSIIHIERLYLQINNGGENVQLNIGEIKDHELRKQLQDIYDKFQAVNAT